MLNRAFDKAKAMLAKEVILSYADINKSFVIVHSNTSDLQLCAVISQYGNKPMTYYIGKLNSAQKNYTVGRKEILRILERLNAFDNILICIKTIVFSDHLNLLYAKNASRKMVRWRLIAEEFAPKEIRHTTGGDNAVDDCL